MDYRGQRLGNYHLVSLLGRGGFADVYLAEHVHLDTQAAVKVLHAQLTSEDVEQFRNEARIIVRLEHPHIVRVLEFGIENDIPFLVMNYAPNGTLRQRHPKETRLPLATILSYVKQIAPALQYAHFQKIVHRDVKPENMLLGRRNEILLTDFGIATVAHSTRSLSLQNEAGTTAYMAPEQIQGKARPASDQYALGVVVYEWLCGERPFKGSYLEVFNQHLSTPPPSLREKVPSVSPEVEQVVMKALAKNPGDRFASVQVFARMLEQAYQSRQPEAQTILSVTDQATILPPKSSNTPQAKTQVDRLLQEARILRKYNRLDEALALNEKVLQLDNTNPLAWQEHGLVEGLRLQHRNALTSFEHALQLDPSLVISYNSKGTALSMLQQNQEALEAFERALQLEPNNASSWNGKGVALNALGRPDQALLAFDMALRFDPQMAQAWSNKGLVLQKQGRYQEALKAFEQAITYNHAVVMWWSAKGSVLYAMGRLQESMQAYQEALKLDKNYAPALYGMGNVLYAQQQLKQALEMFDEAVRCDTRYAEAWNRRGNVLNDLGERIQAFNSYDQALSIDPHYLSAWYGKAGVLCQLERYTEALMAYDNALSINPNFVQAWDGKGTTYYRQGNYAQALEAYERTLLLNPKMASAWHNKSLVLKQMHRYQEALTAAEEAIRLSPDDPDNWQRKVEALRQLRRRGDALIAEGEVLRLRAEKK